MIPVPNGVRVWLATGHAAMRKGFPGLALLVQETLKRDPFDGDLFIFRDRRGDLIKIDWHEWTRRMPVHKEIGAGPLPLMARPVCKRFCDLVWSVCDKLSVSGP